MEAVFPHMDRLVELPSVETLVCTLQKYRKERNAAFSMCIYTQVCGHGLEAHIETGNYLVPMFVECGSMFDAHRVFHRLVRRKEYSWTSLIQGYVEGGECELATDMLQQMRNDCVEPSRFTFVALLKACAVMKNPVTGQEAHNDIAKEGFEGDSFVGNTLVDMYAKCGLLYEARDVFDSLSSQDIVSWNALIAGYADNACAEEVLKCREQMQAEGFQFDEVTYLWSLKACSTIGVINIGRELHSEIAKGEFNSHPFVCNALIDMYAKCGYLAEAQEVFDEMPTHDIVSWTAIIAGYAEQGHSDEALKCLDKMLMEGVLPNTITFMYGLKACGSIVAASRGREIHCEIVIRGFEKDLYIGSSLVDMYSKCGSVVEAQRVFDELLVRDIVSWNAIISGYAEKGLGKEGLECLKNMQLEGLSPNANTFACSLKACSSIGAIKEGQKLHIRISKEGFNNFPTVGSSLVDLYSKCGWLAEAWEEFTKLSPVQDVQLWRCLILGYAEHGDSERALTLFAHMQEQGLLPDNGIFASIIKACGDTAALEIGKRVQSQVCGSNFFDPVIGIALIDMYGRCGGMAEKHVIFDMMPHMDIVNWTALVTGYARQGETDLVLASFKQMREQGVYPNEITFLSVLSTCAHAGLVEEGQKYYESMREEYGIAPTMKHYNCMLDLFIRAGQLDDAVAILEEMHMNFDHVTWSILLGACKKWGDGELAKKAFNCALRTNDKHATPFILMRNILADAQLWKATEKINCL